MEPTKQTCIPLVDLKQMGRLEPVFQTTKKKSVKVNAQVEDSISAPFGSENSSAGWR